MKYAIEKLIVISLLRDKLTIIKLRTKLQKIVNLISSCEHFIQHMIFSEIAESLQFSTCTLIMYWEKIIFFELLVHENNVRQYL